MSAEQPNQTEPVLLKQWAVVFGGDQYTPPESRPQLLKGRLANGTSVVSSPLAAQIDEATFETMSGTQYRLTGPAEPGYAKWRADAGLPPLPTMPPQFHRPAAGGGR